MSRYTRRELDNYIGKNVNVTLFDDSTLSGILGYTPEFSEKYGWRKAKCYTIGKYDFRASHVKRITVNKQESNLRNPIYITQFPEEEMVTTKKLLEIVEFCPMLKDRYGGQSSKKCRKCPYTHYRSCLNFGLIPDIIDRLGKVYTELEKQVPHGRKE